LQTATGVYSAALPAPPVPHITGKVCFHGVNLVNSRAGIYQGINSGYGNVEGTVV